MPPYIRRLVLDVLKPHQPPLDEMASKVTDVHGVDGVNISLVEVDQETQTVQVTIEGTDIDFKKIQQRLTDSGCVIHSVDEVAVGKKLVEKVPTHYGERAASQA